MRQTRLSKTLAYGVSVMVMALLLGVVSVTATPRAGTFMVTTTTDNTSKDAALSLREAMLIAFNGTNSLSAIPNGLSGVSVDSGAYQNHIGSTSENLIEFNNQHGVRPNGNATMSNTLENNFIAFNMQDGVAVLGGAHGNSIGYVGILVPNNIYANEQQGIHLLTGVWGNSLISNVISFDGRNGILLDGATSTYLKRGAPACQRISARV